MGKYNPELYNYALNNVFKKKREELNLDSKDKEHFNGITGVFKSKSMYMFIFVGVVMYIAAIFLLNKFKTR